MNAQKVRLHHWYDKNKFQKHLVKTTHYSLTESNIKNTLKNTVPFFISIIEFYET